MAIHFTAQGIYADTKEERLIFYDKLCEGNPVIWGHLAIYEKESELIKEGTMPPSLKQAIMQLWAEAHNILYISLKLGITDENGDPDTEKVKGIVTNPANYASWREYRRSCGITT